MTNYTKATNFAAKDSLASGNAAKVVKGTEIDTEFTNIETAVNSKSDSANPVFTGVAEFADGSASAPSITNTADTNTGIFFPTADTVGITTGGTESARFDSSGNLGLGVTPSGTWKLDVAGYVKSAAAAGGLYDAVYTGTTAGSTLGQLRFNGSGSGVTAESKIIGALSSGSITSSYLGFYVTSSGSPSQAMTLDSSGNLLVGTTSTAAFIDTKFWLSADSGTTKWGVGPRAALGTAFYVVGQTGSAGVYLPNTSATSWSSASDERLKTEITPFENAAQKVCSLRAGTGRYLTDEETVSRSFLIAQDVQAVLPEAVTALPDEMGTLGLAYTEVIPLLVAAIKEQQAIITQLQDDVAALKGQA